MNEEHDQDHEPDGETTTTDDANDRRARIDGAYQFLTTRWPDDVEDGWITLCHRASTESHGMHVAGAYPIERDALRELAVRAVDLSPSHDVWVLLNALGGKPPDRRKGSEIGLRYLVGLHEDLDLARIDDPLEKVMALGAMAPSLVVALGGGVHAYWLFDAVVDMAAEADWDLEQLHQVRGKYRALAGRFHAWLERELEARFDNCTNLDRVMRLPGTRNHKRVGDDGAAAANVKTAQRDSGVRFRIEQLGAMLDAAGIEAPVGGPSSLDPEQVAAAFASQGTLDGDEAAAVIERLVPVYVHRANTYQNALASRNRSMFDLAQQLNDHGVARDVATDAVLNALHDVTEYSHDGTFDPLTPAEVLVAVASAYSYPPRGRAVNPDAEAATDEQISWAEQLEGGSQNGHRVGEGEGGGGSVGGSASPPPPGGNDSAGGVRVLGERPSNRDTDRANGEALVSALRGRALWVPGEGWLVWDGRRWVPDDLRQRQELLQEQLVLDFVRHAVDAQQGDRDVFLKRVQRLESRGGMENAFHFAEPGLGVRVDELDQDPWLLNTPSGTLDLRTGTVRPHDPADRLTRITPVEYDEAAVDPVWDRSLARLVKHDDDQLWLQRWAGYCLTGLTSAKAIACLHGPADTGKSTLSGAIVACMGSVGTGGYAGHWNAEIIQANSNTNRDAAIAAVRPARLVVAAELSAKVQMDAAFVKAVTGGDLMRARKLYRDEFSFAPQLKLLMHTNHIPRTSDAALQKRLRILKSGAPLTADERDDAVMGYLHHDHSALGAVLAWAVRGAEVLQTDGLGEPVEHREQIEAFARSSDPVVRFVADCLVTSNNRSEWPEKSTVEDFYNAWCASEGVRPMGRYKLWEALDERGIQTRKVQTDGIRSWRLVGHRMAPGMQSTAYGLFTGEGS